jgi:hypothetical protein
MRTIDQLYDDVQKLQSRVFQDRSLGQTRIAVAYLVKNRNSIEYFLDLAYRKTSAAERKELFHSKEHELDAAGINDSFSQDARSILKLCEIHTKLEDVQKYIGEDHFNLLKRGLAYAKYCKGSDKQFDLTLRETIS